MMKRSLSVVTLTLLLILALLAAAVIANDAHMNEDENLRALLRDLDFHGAKYDYKEGDHAMVVVEEEDEEEQDFLSHMQEDIFVAADEYEDLDEIDELDEALAEAEFLFGSRRSNPIAYGSERRSTGRRSGFGTGFA